MSEAGFIWSTAGAVIFALGGGAFLVFSLSSWLGKVWATRIADAERAHFAKELEGYKDELRQLTQERQDALTRKRDIYTELATSLRVFLSRESPPSETEKRDFFAAFDQAALWASEEVALALSSFLQHAARSASQPGSVTNEQYKNAYRECLNAMRRDCGFPNTQFNYPVLTFG